MTKEPRPLRRMTRPLPTEFRHDGFDYRQVKREGNVAMFSQSLGGLVVAYEVVIVRTTPEKTWESGIITPEHEVYPSSSKWGLDGWTCISVEHAEARFTRTVKEVHNAANLRRSGVEESPFTV
jgi:hypothetical protein